MESDIRFFSRRASEEMAAANRAVTPEARARRLQLVDVFVGKLEELKAPLPFERTRTREHQRHELA
jgi:hypothetical protein